MDMLTHLSINLFPAVVLAVIFWDNQRKLTRTAERRLLGVLALSAAGLMAMNAVCGTMAAGETAGAGGLLCVCLVLREVLVVCISGDWLIFVCSHLFTGESKKHRRPVLRISAAVTAVFLALEVTTPWTGLIFSVQEDGYRRGPVWWLPWLTGAALLAESAGIVVYQRGHEVLRDQRTEESQLFWLGIGILAGISIEYWWKGWWLAAPSVSLVMLWLYMNRQNHQITTDGLTGLSNRRRFDQELHRRADQMSGRSWGMLMIDIDDFKWINDNLGHVVGDEALRETAGILRRTFGREKAFLARYGGDEFVVVDDFRDQREAEGVIGRIERELARFNDGIKRDYRISLSIGYALWSEVSHEAPERLVDQADDRMYEKKQKKKAAAAAP